ncbi:18927_t:CDS:10 [Acaulospora morrowiae]|uniref:18927_t:CDS:1 n=1 Tax=Acaulospora morrowiae TaxID=94023 RepID=A0A9N9F4J6_9GLOM|nr:18927_t:CDS:10 [Acaulospora morrowiae]
MGFIKVYQKLRTRTGESNWTILYIVSAIFQMLVSIAIEAVILRLNESSTTQLTSLAPMYDNATNRQFSHKMYNYSNYRTQYLSIIDGNVWFMVIETFLTALCISALFFQNTIEIISIGIINILLLFFAGTQAFQSNMWIDHINDQLELDHATTRFSKNVVTWEAIQLLILTAFAVNSIFLGYKLYKQFGWNIYKRIGANIKTQRMYRTYLVFILLLKLDVFLLMGFQILNLIFLFGDPFGNTRTIIFQSIMVVIVIPVVALALWGVRTENTIAMIICFLASVVTIINFIYILAQFIIERDENLLTLLDILGIVLTVLSILVAYLAHSNFGSGLKDHFQKRNHDGAVNLEADPRKRFSIDD